MSTLDDHPLPASPAQITPAFLTSILQAAGVLRYATVAAIHVEPLEAQTSFNAQLARLRLTYDRQETEAPQSLIAKLPTVVNAELQQRTAILQPGMRECWFYRHGAARTSLNVPYCYYNTVDATGQSFLLLEDLAPARPGNRIDGVSLEEAELALQSLARLHAAWWAAEQELAHLMDNVKEAQDLVERLYQQAWPRFLEHAAFEIPHDARQFGEHLVGRIAEVESLLDHSPRTLIHGDFRLENMLFDTRHGKTACWVIDWEDITMWNGMFDVAWFLGGCLRLEESDAEEGLIQHYHQALIREGVKGYSWAQCYHDYRCAMFSSFVQGILTAEALDPGDQYARNLARILGERFTMASRRLCLHELMPV
jgi:aminoglycoside/choline kinase family phosphotransferase